MKKYGILACAAFMTLLNGRLDAAVESDIVGYTTVAMESGKWYMISNPFVALDSETAMTINTVFNTGFSVGDLAYIYDTETSSYGNQLRYATLKGVTGWFDSTTRELDDTPLNIGQAVFLYKKNANNITFSGKVDLTTAIVFGDEAAPSWAQISCLYPEKSKINDWQWSGMVIGDLAYIYDTENNEYDEALRWANLSEGLGWYDVATRTLSEKELEPGRAIFLYKKSGVGSCIPPAQN